MIGKKLLHYEITQKLGEGGMGKVYKAQDTKLDRVVAIKLLPRFVATHSEEIERFKIEAKSAAALNHPNIATIHAIEEEQVSDEKLLFIVMEYIDGSELREVLSSNLPSLEEAILIALQTAAGLQAAHRKGIIHRDIKSSNVMLNSDGHVKIMDFGLAKISDGKMLTRKGTLLGTIVYMSPEQAQEKEVDHRTDIWSFGVLLYEMLCGNYPFVGEYEQSIIYSIINDEPEPISKMDIKIPYELELIIKKSLTKNIDERYQSFDEIIEDLQNCRNLIGNVNPSTINHINQSFINKNRNYSGNSRLDKASSQSVSERRNITAIVCSFSLVSEGSAEIDPEDTDELLPYCLEICEKVINRFEGFAYTSSMVELSIIYGYPITHEDGAKRAALTALGILEAIKAYSKKIKEDRSISVKAKISIDTGTVIIKSFSKNPNDIEIVGESPITASKIQSITPANSIIVTNETFKLIDGYFECKSLGESEIKSISKPIGLFQIFHESQARSRLDVSLISGLSALTGRKKEFDLLTSSWDNSVEGMGQAISIQGEAGIGKSRLVQEIKEHIASNPKAWLIESFCSPFYQSSSLQPIIELLERNVLRFEATVTDDEKLKIIEGFLIQYGFPLPETVPLLCSLLSVNHNEKYKPLPLTPEAQKQKINETLINLLLKRAESQPVLFIVDDLQWADPTTLDLLGMVIEHIQTSSVFLLLTYRPSFVEPWDYRTHMTKISLNRLPAKEIGNLVLKLTNGKPFPQEILTDIQKKTDGVPLFVEELTKMILNSDYLAEDAERYILKGKFKDLQIPTTLKDSLMARLDKMGTAKEIAQLCATIGREFSYDLIQAISGLNEKKLKSELEKLVKSEILYRKGLVGQERFIFKHALIQDTAYQSILKRKRQEIHKNIATVLADKFSHLSETQPELFAHHYSSAGISHEAITYWYKAGLLSFQRSANIEAITQFNKGLTLLKEIEDGSNRDNLELMILAVLGPATVAIKGFGAEEVGKIFSRSSELCKNIDNPQLMFPSIWGQWVYNLVRSNLNKAQALSEEMLELGNKYDSSAMLIEGYWTQGNNLFWLGDLINAKENLEKAISIYEPDKHHVNAYYYGQDPLVASHCYLSYANWYLGYPDLALKNAEDAIKIAKELNHPFSIGWALAFKMMIAGLRRDPQLTLKAAQETIDYCTDQAYPFWISSAQIMLGWAKSELGDTDEGLKMMESGLSVFSFIGSIVVYPLFKGLIAETKNKMGLIEDALQDITEAIDLAKRNYELASEIDLHRIKGNILLSISAENTHEAENCFKYSIELAEKTNAKSRKLQSVIDLSKILISTKKEAEAKTFLSETCLFFSEGKNTADYLEAQKILLEIK